MDFSRIGTAAATASPVTRPVQEDRVCQADADVFAYNCADLDATVQSNWTELKKHIEYVRLQTASGHINLHLTMGMKNGREQVATVKPYQENRRDRDEAMQKRVWELRHLMANYRTDKVTPVDWQYIEADDGMAQYQTKRILETGDVKSSIIFSIDKDLWMVSGYHMDTKTFEMYLVSGYGETSYRDVGNVKPKLIGRGTSWFWHQLIMGDKADNIPGLPKLSGRLANIYLPTKKINPKRTALACGEAKAVAILKGVTTDREALRRVREAYKDHYGVAGDSMMFEQAYLLWMQRTDNLLDVVKWWKDTCDFSYKLTTQQTESLSRYTKLKLAAIAQEQTNA